MKSSELLKDIPFRMLCGSLDREVTGLCADTRSVSGGDVFICIKGARFDSHSQIARIAEADPALIVVSEEWTGGNGAAVKEVSGANIVAVADTREAKAFIAAAFYGYPSKKLTVIGITGSKGKTTSAHMITSILEKAGFVTGLIGTNGAFTGQNITESSGANREHYTEASYSLANTTPDSEEMQKYLAEMVRNGCTHAVIECSSQGLMLHRCDAIDFAYGIFTNIEHGDHVGPNEHSSFEEYLYCKGLLLKKSRTAIVNRDNEHTAELLADVETPVIYYGESEGSDYRISQVADASVAGTPGTAFRVSGRLEDSFEVDLPGTFNAWNALAAIAVTNELGISREAMKDALSAISIKGRLEMVYSSPELSICVDFAHNGYSTRNLLTALRKYEPKRLVCVFGADGNRAVSRRIEMGEASGSLADLSIITSGHNRWETFDQILPWIKQGIDPTHGEYIVIPDREEAIRHAVYEHEDGDLVAIIGLGHENYQEANGVKRLYSDREFALRTVKEYLESRGK
ncbi:MAG: UDP-N-acetylmuramoyl-L-alanyl-D-glutamate--2,6-diaminopimelate ligase [Lachnospiraceae bacterium]|nr:UDP-N-acetylmuramoyl-L-alanyl-D-glutamate--2,6-diaminopimelate ligase [Lachnospiraceae bacterium]